MGHGMFTPIAEIAQQATRVSESLRRTNSVPLLPSVALQPIRKHAK